MAEKVEVQSVSEIITSKAGRQYFTFEDMTQKRYVCFIAQLREYCKVASTIEADIVPGKTSDDSPRLDMIYVDGKPVISVEKKVAGRSYGKSKEELAQIKQLAEAQNLSIQAQVALKSAVDLAVATLIKPDKIVNWACIFRDYLNGNLNINDAQLSKLLTGFITKAKEG